MVQRVEIRLSDGRTLTTLDDEGVGFTLAGLKTFLNEVEVRDDYVEGQYGSEVKIPIGLLYRYAQIEEIETVSGGGFN